MIVRESDRMKTKLLALNLRLAELSSEMERTRLRMLQLESEVEDARLASLFGESEPRLGDLNPQLEQARIQLEGQRETIRRVRKSQHETQFRYHVARQLELAQERATRAPSGQMQTSEPQS